MSGEPGGVYRFGDFVLDVAAYELRRGGRRVQLERQPMDLLILLVERPGQLVTHEEIASRLWGEGAFVEVGTGIHSAVRKIRRALRDDAESPRYVASVARRGYRFVAPLRSLPLTSASGDPAPAVSANGESPSDAALASLPDDRERDPDRAGARTQVGGAHGARRIAIALLVVAVAGIAGWAVWTGLGDRAPAGRIRLALLPFENVSGDEELNYLVRGLADESIAALVQVDPRHLSVVGRTSTRSSGSDDRSTSEIGRVLGADYLLEGSVRAEADRLRLTVQLIRVRGMVGEWAASFDRERGGLLGLERELARAVAEQVRLKLSPERAATAARRQTRVPEAYDHFLRGRHLAAQRTQVTVLEAIESFEAAITADSDYALAWAEIANAYAALPVNSDFPPIEAWRKAHRAAERAAGIRPDLAETQVALGRIGLFDRDWPAAESALRRALAIDPDLAEAHWTLGHLLSQTGRQDEALAEMAQARGLDPFSAVNHALSAQVAFQTRDFEGALAHARQALVLAPEFWIGLMQEGQALEQLGEPDRALAALERAIRLSGGNSKPVSLAGYVLARGGRTQEAREVLTQLEETARDRFVPPYAMALIHAGLDEPDAALEWLERGEQVRDVHLVFLPVDPKWDPLRADPRFQALLDRTGLRGGKRVIE